MTEHKFIVVLSILLLSEFYSFSDRAYSNESAETLGPGKRMTLQLETSDHQHISVNHYSASRSQVLILAPGFFNNKGVYLFKKIAEGLFESYDIIAFDFRGHGNSSGLFTWTAHEPQDLEEVVKYAKAQGYGQIGVVGFSLGAAVTLIVASTNRNINSVITISAPFDFAHIDYHFWEPAMWDDLKLNLGYKGKGKGVRVDNPFMTKIKPLDIVAKISPTPVFFIHGAKDWLIKPYHSEKLYQKAMEPKRLLIMPDAGHAEIIYDTHPKEFIDLCKQWFEKTLK
jgi:pimeloyl-ACP methyl ester carboxylesterase